MYEIKQGTKEEVERITKKGTQYPIDKLEAGEYFDIPVVNGYDAHKRRVWVNQKIRFAYPNKERRFRTETLMNGEQPVLRVWRLT